MSSDNYLNAINEARDLLTELLNDPEHGKLTFKGLNGLNDLTITSPRGLNGPSAGTVLIIDGDEWMAITGGMLGPRQWQHYKGTWRVTNEELYILALENASDLKHCHDGLSY